MNKKAIVLDYGHGGSDPGAVCGKHIERNYNLDTGLACAKELRRHGVKVYETRTNNSTTLSLSQRCAIANSKDAYYFVSIHHNAGGGDRGEAIHSIYNGDSKDLAESISKELEKCGQSTMKVYSRKGSNGDYYGVIRGTIAKAVIVECAFVDNKEDVKFVDTLAERQRNGIAIAHGILREMGIKIEKEEVKEEVKPAAKVIYRVRKTWKDSKSQKGAYTDLDNAIIECKKHKEYKVYDDKGKVVFEEFRAFLVKIIVDELNVRENAGVKYDIVTQVHEQGVFTIIEEKDGWGKLKSGIGWISLDKKYIRKL